jgi:hypothetical protein
VDGADDLRVLLGEVVERAAVHADVGPVGVRHEALLVQQAHDLLDRLLVGDAA